MAHIENSCVVHPHDSDASNQSMVAMALETREDILPTHFGSLPLYRNPTAASSGSTQVRSLTGFSTTEHQGT